jgi:hypothetical protein
MIDKTNLMLEMIKALVRQGITKRYDGTITWAYCKYCNRSGWTSPDGSGYPMAHDQDCFIKLAEKWIANKTENSLMELL